MAVETDEATVLDDDAWSESSRRSLMGTLVTDAEVES